MKYLRLIIIPIVAILIGLNISCERDDICAESTPTTPRLLIDLYDSENRENQKNAPRLLAFANVNGSDIAVAGYEGLNTQSSLVLPLRTDDNTSTFFLVKDATFDDENNLILAENNIDTLEVTYEREEVYVSRACGYKTIFKNINLEIVADSDNWLIGTPENLTENDTVENENATHFNFFH
ncbi:DUF6452 family protein [Seonamhaeicola marinus]|uniref:Uncharacterized protein n=1 Tax=Seonamhaeicola marinus TaxID=1912246 RepID=A0A5D0HK34_9FLAO|nr:DUF6452 family protein [Seonamhaeicola marinus]TYA71666.1 hypothetical protein FUA24_19065 [Seonamhaeicola marinus]